MAGPSSLKLTFVWHPARPHLAALPFSSLVVNVPELYHRNFASVAGHAIRPSRPDLHPSCLLEHARPVKDQRGRHVTRGADSENDRGQRVWLANDTQLH